MFLTASAYGQCVGAPLQALTGTWVYKLQTAGLSLDLSGLLTRIPASDRALAIQTGATLPLSGGAIGRFVAAPGVDPRAPGITQGLLTAIETSNGGPAGVARLATLTGKYVIFQDCSGGTITLDSPGPGIAGRSYDFFFLNNFTEMYLVSIDTTGAAVVGTAKKL